jgi:hypothetical protein
MDRLDKGPRPVPLLFGRQDRDHCPIVFFLRAHFPPPPRYRAGDAPQALVVLDGAEDKTISSCDQDASIVETRPLFEVTDYHYSDPLIGVLVFIYLCTSLFIFAEVFQFQVELHVTLSKSSVGRNRSFTYSLMLYRT